MARFSGPDIIDFDSITHTVVVSRGSGLKFFPSGDDDPSTVDTSICQNELVLSQANCPTCYGDLLYQWDNSFLNTPPTSTPVNGEIFQSHTSEPITATDAQFTALNPAPGPPGPSTPFTVELELLHGEGSVCVETVYREIGYISISLFL